MIEVAVIGAGSAGLVTARHLLASGLKCCIFEATSTIGGAWSCPPSPPSITPHDASDGMMWKGLHTNLSKHTCRFSDFPWPDDTPTFPSKEDMDSYLTSYANEFFLVDCNKDKEDEKSSDNDSSCSLLYDCNVTKISPIVGSSPADDQQYRVEWTDSVHQTKHSKEFGGVVIATGFFSRPKYPSGFLPEILGKMNRNDDSNADRRMKILHSKDYGSHELFATKSEKVVVVGSSHSALEIAVDVSKSVDKDVPVTVVMPTIPWVVPRYVPDPAATSPSFLPIDLAFYRRQNSKEECTFLTPDSCRKRHEGLRAILGSRQDSILPVPRDSFGEAPTVAVSDYFLDLVADGRIEVIHGRVEGTTDDGEGLRIARADSAGSDASVMLPGVSSVICCTGFLPDLESCCGPLEDGSSESEPLSILKTVDYDFTNPFAPMTTYLETLHPNLTNFAFVGMYRGPYMGAVELQARLAAGVLSKKVSISEEDFDKGLEISERIRNPEDSSLRPQFPRFDYIGFMDSLTGSLFSSGSTREQAPWFPAQYDLTEGSMVTPAFYQPNQGIADLARHDLDQEIEKGTNGHHLPRVVTSALIGSWSFERNILHFSGGGRTIAQRQYIHGKVRYSRSKDLGHVLYREDGLFEISESKSLPVFREYEYVCSRDEDGGGGALELYFVEGGKRTYIFLSLKFQHQDKDGYWVATNDHLCIKDLYKANFRIKLNGLAATEVIITYRVKGPAKDYESTTVMRPQ